MRQLAGEGLYQDDEAGGKSGLDARPEGVPRARQPRQGKTLPPFAQIWRGGSKRAAKTSLDVSSRGVWISISHVIVVVLTDDEVIDPPASQVPFSLSDIFILLLGTGRLSAAVDE